jgi:type I restriction enzyme S subunit
MNTINMETWAIGAALPYIRGVDLEKIKLDHLDKGGLIKAAEVENEINHLIDLLVNQSNKLDDCTSAIFRSWFIDFEPIVAKERGRLPIGMDGKFAALFPNCFEVTSELGNIPADWKVKNLTEICEIQRGFSYSGDSLCEREKGVAMVNLASFIEGGGYKHSGIKYISSEFKEKFFIKNGDVLIATVDLTPGLRVVGSPLIAPSFLEDNSIFSQDLLRLRKTGEEPLGRGFLYHWLKIQRGVLKQWSSGTTVSRFPISALDKYSILIPTENILEQFELIFERNRKLMELISMKIRDLVYTKNTLIPKLMSIEVGGLV